MEPVVTKAGFLSIQVCVPKDYTDEQVKAFAELAYPCGTTNGWFIRKQDERVVCDTRIDCVHVMLDA